SPQGALRGGASAFTDVTSAWGFDIFGHGMGVALGDVDEDGYTDAVISTIGGFIEWKGTGPGGFVPRGPASIYETRRRNSWPNAVPLAALDNDGHLDLFAANQFASQNPEPPLMWVLTLGGPADFVGSFDTVVFKNGPTLYTDSILPYDAILPHHG